MAKIGDYTISDIYQGGYSTLDPSKNLSPSMYPFNSSGVGMSSDARTANIVKEISENLNAGAKAVELTQVDSSVFEAIPKDQFKELNRLIKLTGVEISVHAPVVEPSGFSREGGFSESNREAVERQMNFAIERSHEINPNGNIPVTFHSSAVIPGELKSKDKKEIDETLIINTETGSVNRIPIKKLQFPGEGEASVKNTILNRNEETWRQALSHLAYNTERGKEVIDRYGATALASALEKKKGEELSSEQKHAMSLFNMGTAFLNDSYRELKELYNIAITTSQKNGNKKDFEKLKELEKNIYGKIEEINKSKDNTKSIWLRQEIVEEGLEVLNKINIPEIFKSLNEFSRDKTIETFGNVAFNSYKNFKDKAPMICIENPPIGGAFSTGEELKEIVEASRKQFVKKATENGISKSEAEEQAEKLIGVTWDVGHINMMRKHGYNSKDIIKETEKIAKLVKHVHLSDNFGLEHTELPMGMGNVPIKEIMEKLGKEGYKGKKIIEALQWWQHFSHGGKQNPPLRPTFEMMGSPIYADGVGPYWNQNLGLQQGYSMGYGLMLPSGNYGMWGSGFSMASLPIELGGQTPGAQGSRMSGRGME